MDYDETNPWLNIPLDDYEAHMSDPNVLQHQALSKIFGEIINRYAPNSIAVLGCSGGNGFEHLVNKNITRLVGIDLNPDYLNICEERFYSSIPNLELICSDLNELDLEPNSFDLIHAALIFEYVEIEVMLHKIVRWLKPGGFCSIVLQLKSEKSPLVSNTPYNSLQILGDKIKLVEPDEFTKLVNKYYLFRVHSEVMELKLGKKFLVQCYQKRDFKK